MSGQVTPLYLSLLSTMAVDVLSQYCDTAILRYDISSVFLESAHRDVASASRYIFPCDDRPRRRAARRSRSAPSPPVRGNSSTTVLGGHARGSRTFRRLGTQPRGPPPVPGSLKALLPIMKNGKISDVCGYGRAAAAPRRGDVYCGRLGPLSRNPFLTFGKTAP